MDVVPHFSSSHKTGGRAIPVAWKIFPATPVVFVLMMNRLPAVSDCAFYYRIDITYYIRPLHEVAPNRWTVLRGG